MWDSVYELIIDKYSWESCTTVDVREAVTSYPSNDNMQGNMTPRSFRISARVQLIYRWKYLWPNWGKMAIRRNVRWLFYINVTLAIPEREISQRSCDTNSNSDTNAETTCMILNGIIVCLKRECGDWSCLPGPALAIPVPVPTAWLPITAPLPAPAALAPPRPPKPPKPDYSGRRNSFT